MNKSSRIDIALEEQRRHWNDWNAAAREARQGPASQCQARVVEERLSELGRTDLSIIDIGCGVGWMSERMTRFGAVTGTDLADEVLVRARLRAPQVRFVSGDFLEVDLPLQGFDIAVALEVLSHVADQPAFLARVATLLVPGGLLMLATQNRPVLERWSQIGPPAEGQIRRWVNARELRELLAPHFERIAITSVMPVGDKGLLRIFNSPKLNRLAECVVSARRIERAKERGLLGHTLIAVVRKRPAH